MLLILWQIFLFVIVLSFLVVIHELGHYLVAKWRKVRVEEFGIGYPPRALKLFSIGETLFSLNWIPFGGFVKLEGEEGPTEDEKTGKVDKSVPAIDKKLGLTPFYAKGKISRLAIILAGATVNFVFGILAFSLYFSVKGIPEIAPRIGAVAAHSPVADASVPTNVNIIGFEYNQVTYHMSTTDEVIAFVTQHQGKSVVLDTTGICTDTNLSTSCDEALHRYPLTIRTQQQTPKGEGALGISFSEVITFKFYPWYQMPIRGTIIGFQQAFLLAQLIVVSLGGIFAGLFHGQVPTDVAGPVGIFNQAKKAGFLSGDMFDLLNLAGKLSVNLAIMNILPIPALDGGRAFFILIESFFKKKRLLKIEGWLNYVAFGLLLLLTLVITFKDIAGLFIKN